MAHKYPWFGFFVGLVLEYHEGQKWNQSLEENVDDHFPAKFVYSYIIEMAHQRSRYFFGITIIYLFEVIKIYNSLVLLRQMFHFLVFVIFVFLQEHV